MKVYNVLIINEINEIKTFNSLEKARKFKDEKVAEIEEYDYDIDTETDDYVYAIGENDDYTIKIFENEIE